MYNPFDHYFNKAKQKGYKARSAFKLEEIQEKFHILQPWMKSFLDIWCSPGSWLQYVVEYMKKEKKSDYIGVGFDIKPVPIQLPNIHTYVQDVTDESALQKVFDEHNISQFDCILSDMAPSTIGVKDIDARRLFGLLRETLRVYEQYLHPQGTFAIKVFMGPWFDEFVQMMKKKFGWKNIKVFKPKSCRKESKETYVIKTSSDI